jgi:hypothetical protein
MIDTTKYRVRIVAYDDVSSTAENPMMTREMPFYGVEELELWAGNFAQDLRKHIETDS